MRLDVAFTPAETGGSAGDRAVVVIDVLRTTSTILEALVNGVQAVVPVESVEQAVSKAHEIGRDHALLCGERDCEPIEGFALGNSPFEFTAERVAGKTLVMTTSNGTRALALGANGASCRAGSFMNATAVAEAVRQGGGDVLLLCAGRDGRFALEDALCAGVLALRIIKGRERGAVSFNDAARVAMLLARRYERSLARVLLRSAAGRRLAELGRRKEVEYCAQLDRHARVPVVRDRRVTL